MDTKTPKGRRRLLIVGALVLAGVLILVYLSKNNQDGSGSNSNKPTAVEFSSSWNSSNTWASPSGSNWWHRQPTTPTGRKGPWNARDPFGGHSPPFRWDSDHDKKIFQGRK